MMPAWLRRFNTPLTAFILLLALIAAPYLTTENPDSAVFRSGTLGCLLLLFCASPVKRALETKPMRALVYGCAFGFVFAVCLSLGAELRVYDGFLPGFGSLARRIAVPCMIAPLFGTLAAYVFDAKMPQNPPVKRPIPYIAFFLCIAACYTLVMLALYPGVISYDFEHEIRQFTTGEYFAAHPVFHTLFLGSLYALGEALFGGMTEGAAMYSAVQLLLLAAMYAWACCFVQRRVTHRLPVILLAACFSLLPFHGVMAVSTAKDPLFTGLCLLLCLFLWEIAEDPAVFVHSRLRMIRFALCCLLMALLRHNGVFAYMPACIAVLLMLGLRHKKALTCMAVTLTLTLLIPRGLEFAVDAQKTPGSEMMSVPCQQLMRTANYADLSEKEFSQIERWFPGKTHTYRPHCADPAKGGNFNFARYQQYPMAYWKTWAKYGLKHPRIYIEAFLNNCVGLWYPDDISHAHSLSTEEWSFIYMNTVFFYADQYPIEVRSKLPALHKLIYASTHSADHQKVPLLAQLFCPAVYSFLLLLTTMRLRYTGRKRAALCTLPVWGIFVSLLFSAGIFIRYAYPIMTVTPVLLILAYFTNCQTE